MCSEFPLQGSQIEFFFSFLPSLIRDLKPGQRITISWVIKPIKSKKSPQFYLLLKPESSNLSREMPHWGPQAPWELRLQRNEKQILKDVNILLFQSLKPMEQVHTHKTKTNKKDTTTRRIIFKLVENNTKKQQEATVTEHLQNKYKALWQTQSLPSNYWVPALC